MNTYMKHSVLVASLLVGTMLSADSLRDSVAVKEANALHATAVQGEAAAKAAVEEANSKELFLGKMASKQFSSEAKSDRAKKLHQRVNAELLHHKKKSEQTPQELIDAFKQTILAMQSLESNQVKTAQQALDKAITDFESVLKADPTLDRIAIADDVQVDSLDVDAASVKKMIKEAQKLLERYETQAARAILLPMKDEMVLSTTYLPMKLYPDAMKEAQKALKADNAKRALAIMQTALDSVIVETISVPISLLTAQDLITVASKLDPAKKKEAQHLLEIAADELQKAILLGYIKKYESEYKSIKKEIHDVQKEIEGENRVEKFYDRLKQSFHHLMKKIRTEVTKH